MGHEGVAYRWETFNRWCDEFAEKHQGLKPKVDDVRRWHRENAEKVWPDSNERPSVFMAVSHNKGRRVRGSKTCEYYKRYRAGKAAEQQLAARLQPAALSGRRILAVTAAARKLNSDGSSRGPGKRHAQDDVGSEEHADGSHEQPEKRRRMQTGHRGQAHGGSRGGSARGRRSSSEDMSEDPSWASGAESSEDEDSGGNEMGSGSMRSSRHPSALQQQQQQQPGVHITVVRRDADGRTIQVQSAASPMLTGLLPLPGAPPLFQPPAAVPGSSGRAVAQPLASNGLQRRSSGQVEGGSDDALACKEDASDGLDAQPRADSATQRPRRQRRAVPVEEPEEGDEVMPDELQQLRLGRRSATQDWDWGPDGHPGIAPLECRSSRSASVLQPALPPPLSGHVDTPLGSLPVYLVAASSGGIMAARRRIAEQRRKKAAAVAAAATVAAAAAAAAPAPTAVTTTTTVAAPAAPNATACASAAAAAQPVAVAPARPTVAVAAPAGAPVGHPGATKDPLDLLAQAACEALATPVPPRAGLPAPLQADQPKEGGATTGPQEAVGDAMDCKVPAPEAAQPPAAEAGACGPGISEGSAHSGGGFAPPGCRGQSVPEAAPELVPVKEEKAGAAADDAQSSGQHAPAGAAATKAEGNGLQPAVSECVSASTQNSGGPHAALGAQPAAQAPAPAEAAAQAQLHQGHAQVHVTTASPHSSAALLATDAVDWATTGDGDTEATGCTHAPKQDPVMPLLDVGAAATTSSVATAPSAATVALPAPAAAAAAQGRCPSAGATSDATGALPSALAPLLTPDMSMNFAYMAAANAAAVNMATMAAAFLRAQPPLPQPVPQQPAPALPLTLPGTGTTAQGVQLPGAAPAVPQPLGSVSSVMSSFLLPPPPPVGSLPLPPAQPAAPPPLLTPGTLPLLPPPLWHSMPASVPAMPPSMAAAAAVAAAPPLFQESPAAVLGAPPAGCNQLLPVMRLFMASTGHPDQAVAAGAQPAPAAGSAPPGSTAAPQLPPVPLPLPPVPQPSALPTACAMPGCMPPPVMDLGLVGVSSGATQQHTSGFLLPARPLQPSQ